MSRNSSTAPGKVATGNRQAPVEQGPPQGLSILDISARRCARVVGGDFVAWRIKRRDVDFQVSAAVPVEVVGQVRRGGKRRAITAFSERSQRRMVDVARNLPPLVTMITLTYPRVFTRDGARVKRDWKAIRDWLMDNRSDGKPGPLKGFWFLEFQPREKRPKEEQGAPHFHIVADGWVDRRALSRAWFRIVASSDPRHLRAGTKIEALRFPDDPGRYAARYAGKCEQKAVPEGYGNVGRFWGLFGGLEPVVVASGVAPRAEVAPMKRALVGMVNARQRAAGRRKVRNKSAGKQILRDVREAAERLVAAGGE